MAFPSSAHPNPPQTTPAASTAALPGAAAAPAALSQPVATAVSTGLPRPAHHHGGVGAATRPFPQVASCEGEHQLEKLQFALAVALTRGDRERELRLREQIADFGGNGEEPGT